MTRVLALVGTTAVALALASAVEGSAPRYIFVSGPALARPVLLANWKENRTLLAALADAPKAEEGTVRLLDGRRALRLGLFWGWPAKPRPTRPYQANQEGWFYPAAGSQPPVVELAVGASVPRIAPARMLRIFARHGVPTRVAAPPPEPEPPSLCSGDEVETLVARFLDAFNSGDLKGLDDVFAHEPDFEWYSTGAPGERFTPLANDRPSLVPYFATRHALDEQLTLRSFRFNGNSASRQPYGNFEYGLTRRAEDLPATPYNGKGAAFCHRTRSDVIFVWSMGPQ
ncbi:MAG: nuclear transport factor 2 family protein [Actinobacteria bacterium]|nr:nuclear transport factor 2 family protein [Actinomycetota bacterium]